MAFNPLGRLFDKRGGKRRQAKCRSRTLAHQVKPRLEALETRLVPSVSPHLLKDINPGTAPSNAGQLTDVSGTLFFQAKNGVSGQELWRTNGTAAGTVLVRDINPGAPSAFPISDPILYTLMTNVNGTLFFSAYDSSHGYQLWKSDGTGAGTSMVRMIQPASPALSPPLQLTNVNGTLFFVADDGVRGQELWKSNGTAAGTITVKDINAGSEGSTPDFLTNVNGTLFFQADNGVSGPELWRSNGTPAGTVLVKDLNPGSTGSSPQGLTNVNGLLFFQAADAAHGAEPWVSNGTAAGTFMIKDLNPGTNSSFPIHFTNANGVAMFAADDGKTGLELWRSNGATAGTYLIKDINPGPAGSQVGKYPFFDLSTTVNGVTYFIANNGVSGFELWKTDGTAPGTVLVKDINPGSATSRSIWFTNVNGTVYFAADNGVSGQELWQTNGTAAGTALVRDIYPGAPSSGPFRLTNVNGTLFFSANDGAHGVEPWVLAPASGASSQTVAAAAAMSPTLTQAQLPVALGFSKPAWDWASGMATGDSKSTAPTAITLVTRNVPSVVFAANDGVHGVEPWASDGSGRGTVLLKDITLGAAGSDPTDFTDVNGTVFFSVGSNLADAPGLWRTDGTPAGTVLVRPIYSSDLQNVNGTLFFNGAEDRYSGRGAELWKSDGTAAGTVRVKDIYAGFVSSGPDYLTNVNGALFFWANDGVHGRELWKSNGTAAGAVLVRDINPGTSDGESMFERMMLNVNGTLVFNANDGAGTEEVWRSDGTTAGTVLLKNLQAGETNTVFKSPPK
jgi:ELWxxDGT repeat protein